MDVITELDGKLLIGIQNALGADWLTPVMKVITYFGEAGIFWIVLCLILIICKKTRRLGIICTASLLLTFICCNLILKLAVDRIRPWVTFAEVVRYLEPPGDASFPSGHSASSMGPAWAMFVASLPGRPPGGGVASYSYTPCLGWKGRGANAWTVHRFSIMAVLLAILIGLSRLYLGMHFPTDVLCGLLLGMLCASIIVLVIRKTEQERGKLIGE